MLNRVVLVGRLTKDPDLRYTPNGVAVTNFTLAVNRTYSNKQGEREADFINCVVWQKTAENVAQYVKKGSLIGVDGQIQSRNYDNNDGRKVFVTEVVAGSVQFLESKKQDNNQKQNTQGQDFSRASNRYNQDPFTNNDLPINISDDDLPF